MRKIFFIGLMMLMSFHSHAQEILSPQPDAVLLTKFPFKQFSGGVILIRAQFENIPDTLNFILDTGSGGISLDSATCSEYGIETRQTDTLITGIAGVKKVHFAFNKKLHLPGLTVEALNFHVNDYELLSGVYGEKIDGIIGYNFLSRYIVKINFDSLTIEVYKPGKLKYPNQGTLLHPLFTSLPIVDLQVRDRNRISGNFYYDTGAGLCLLLSEEFARDSAVILKRRKPVITQAEGMGGMLKMRMTVVKELRLGPYRFRRVPTYLYDDTHNITSYPFTGGLIGNDILRRFNVILNYPQREIHLKPNGHFTDPFDYTYTGLGFYFIDGQIMVLDVIPNSPSALAGFQVGDEIIGVGNNISRNIQLYKQLFQVPNEKIKVIIRRNNKLLELFMKTGSIL